MNNEREKMLVAALKLAVKYMQKADEMGVYDNCALTGKTAIKRILEVLGDEQNDV